MSKKPLPDNDLNSTQMVPAALKWLYEMEAVNSPALLNNLYGNIYAYPGVVDAEVLIDRFNKRMLIWIQFKWSLRKIFKNRRKSIIMDLLTQLQELLPSFSFRVIEERELFDLALKRWTERFDNGGKNEKAIIVPAPVPAAVTPAASEPNGEPKPVEPQPPVNTPSVPDEVPTSDSDSDSKKPS